MHGSVGRGWNITRSYLKVELQGMPDMHICMEKNTLTWSDSEKCWGREGSPNILHYTYIRMASYTPMDLLL